MRRLRSPMQVLLAGVPPMLTRLASHNQGIAPVPLTRGKMVVVSKPEHVKTILASVRTHEFGKGGWAERRIIEALGPDGLFTTGDGAWWEKLRGIMNPAFKRTAMGPVAELTLQALEKRMETWKPGTITNLFEEFKRINIEVLARHLFGAAITNEEVAEISRLAGPVFEGMAWQVFLPKWLPGGRKYHRAINRLEDKVYKLIDDRLSDHQLNPEQQGDDLLWQLIASDEPVLLRRQLRDQVFTILMAGFDSTAVVLSEAARVLAGSRQTVHELRAELHAATNGQPIGWHNLRKLRQLELFVRSVLRDRPAFPNYFRVVLAEDCQLGTHVLKAGTQLIIALYAMHHMHDYDRDEKDELRFIPFGHGKRKCIGEDMAMVTMLLILGRMLQQYSHWELNDPTDDRTVYAMTERHFNSDMRLAA